MAILKLKPALKDYLWGGHRLVDEFDLDYQSNVLAEAWELSCHPDGPSIIENGPYKGKTLAEYLTKEGFESLGTNCRRFKEFPILIKLIDAKEALSIQVHPSNGYALKNEGQYGKTEMWYVLDAKEDAFLYYGFKKEITKEEFKTRIKNNTLLEVLNPVPVHPGDVLFIESGTLHAIGAGVLIAEIQQNSNITYRIYDYGRVGKDGKLRDLHIEKALDVTSRIPIKNSKESYPHVADCDYFTVDKLNLDGKITSFAKGNVNEESFLSMLIIDGKGTISTNDETINYKKGDSILITANSGEWKIEGVVDALITTIRKKENPLRIGTIISSRNTQIGLVNSNQEIVDMISYPTDSSKSSTTILDEVSDNIIKLLENNKVSFDQCISVGVGIPGIVDNKKGIVKYSNNIRWSNVDVIKELSKTIPCPIFVANDGDCAALGEKATGSGIAFENIVMLTLGNGVGSGVILNNEIIGGSEFGHMIIENNGNLCTCGRKGCLEAYLSTAVLLKEANESNQNKYELKDIFTYAKNGDEKLQKLVDNYLKYLSAGIVNIVNIFRPQLIILGGIASEYLEDKIPEIEAVVKKEIFGGIDGRCPAIVNAKLGNDAGIIGAANL